MPNFNVQNGMTVRSADGDKLGKIIAVDGGSIIIEKGIFFPKDYIAPLDQIQGVTDDDVFLRWGTDLVETKYDALYGMGAYSLETASDEWLARAEERRVKPVNNGETRVDQDSPKP